MAYIPYFDGWAWADKQSHSRPKTCIFSLEKFPFWLLLQSSSSPTPTTDHRPCVPALLFHRRRRHRQLLDSAMRWSPPLLPRHRRRRRGTAALRWSGSGVRRRSLWATSPTSSSRAPRPTLPPPAPAHSPPTPPPLPPLAPRLPRTLPSPSLLPPPVRSLPPNPISAPFICSNWDFLTLAIAAAEERSLVKSAISTVYTRRNTTQKRRRTNDNTPFPAGTSSCPPPATLASKSRLLPLFFLYLHAPTTDFIHLHFVIILLHPKRHYYLVVQIDLWDKDTAIF